MAEYFTLNEYCEDLKQNSLFCKADLSEVKLEYLSYNSTDIKNNTLFVCKGAHFKDEYLKMAIEAGAVAYISEKEYEDIEIPHIVVSDIRKAMPIIASRYYRNPADSINIIGITGTKGKSTVTYYIRYILNEYLKAVGKNESAVISGIDVYDGVINEEAHLSTPEAMDLQRHFRNAVDSGIEFVEMEVSSQALKYDRVDGVVFDVGVFLNISEDHISPIEHPDYQDYFESKLRIFAQTKNAVVNLDSDFADKVMKSAKVCENVITFSLKDKTAAVFGYEVAKKGDGISFSVKTAQFDCEFELTVSGLFNVENALAAIAAVSVFNIPKEYIYAGLKKARSDGRMEVFKSKDTSIIAIVDYAHNKLSFEKLFESVKKEYPNREIISIFGCPGVKAILRREHLGTLAGKNADKVYIVAEDPGYEPVEKISKEVAYYVEKQGCPYIIIEDRGVAIRDAIMTANKNCVILITGKGRETRQKYGAEYIPCPSDVEYTQRFLEEYNNQNNSPKEYFR